MKRITRRVDALQAIISPEREAVLAGLDSLLEGGTAVDVRARALWAACPEPDPHLRHFLCSTEAGLTVAQHFARLAYR